MTFCSLYHQAEQWNLLWCWKKCCSHQSFPCTSLYSDQDTLSLSTDVKTFYSSIPHKHGCQAVTYFLSPQGSHLYRHKDIEYFVIRLLEFVLTRHYFLFNGWFYHQPLLSLYTLYIVFYALLSGNYRDHADTTLYCSIYYCSGLQYLLATDVFKQQSAQGLWTNLTPIMASTVS